MARVSEVAFRRSDGTPTIGQLYLSYVGHLRCYIATAVLDGRHENFLRISAVEALRDARAWLTDQGLASVGERPAQGTHCIRIVRATGAAFATDGEIGIPLDDDEITELATFNNPAQLMRFLSVVLPTRLGERQRQLLQEWVEDPTVSWVLLPADAQRAVSDSADFDVDECVRSFIREHRLLLSTFVLNIGQLISFDACTRDFGKGLTPVSHPRD